MFLLYPQESIRVIGEGKLQVSQINLSQQRFMSALTYVLNCFGTSSNNVKLLVKEELHSFIMSNDND